MNERDDPRLPKVPPSTREEQDEQLRRIWRHEREALRGREEALERHPEEESDFGWGPL